jgi:branched-chain amino acid aminotransferase
MSLWLNGRLVPDELVRLDPRDRGFTLGDGLFETIRLEDRWIAYLERHLARLRDGADFLGIPLHWSDAEIETGLSALAAAEGLSDAAFRITLTRGPGERGIAPPAVPVPTLMITAGPLPPAGGPLRAVIATVTRRNEASPLSRLKTLNYLDNILARREALARGADEAILLNTQGAVAEASIANLFILSDGVLKTPPIADGAMPGIMRRALIERCGAVEAHLMPADLTGATALFLSNSLGLRPIATIDGVPVGNDRSIAAVAKLARIVLTAE